MCLLVSVMAQALPVTEVIILVAVAVHIISLLHVAFNNSVMCVSKVLQGAHDKMLDSRH